MVEPGSTGPEGSMSMTVPGSASLKTSTPVTRSPRLMSSLRTSLYCRPRYASGTRLTAAGVDSVGSAEVVVGLGLCDVGEVVVVGLELMGLALETTALLLEGACVGNRMPAWVRTTPTKAKSTSRISAI